MPKSKDNNVIKDIKAEINKNLAMLRKWNYTDRNIATVRKRAALKVFDKVLVISAVAKPNKLHTPYEIIVNEYLEFGDESLKTKLIGKITASINRILNKETTSHYGVINLKYYKDELQSEVSNCKQRLKKAA